MDNRGMMRKCFPLILLCQIWHGEARHGTATFYTPPYLPSSCNGFEDMGTMIAAASEAIWDNRSACGRHYRVRCKHTHDGPSPCKDKSVVVKITDFCPPKSCHGTIDLSQEAFKMIADPAAGVVDIEFHRI